MTRRVAVLVVAVGMLGLCHGCAWLQNNPPQASFAATPASGPVPLVVFFDASASADYPVMFGPDAWIVSYSWNFGDGETGSGVTTSHTYDPAGNYLVTLTIKDNQEAGDSATLTVVVQGREGQIFTLGASYLAAIARGGRSGLAFRH